MTVHFIRHGMTRANEQRMFCGACDPSLSERGVQLLTQAKAQMNYPKPALFFTSGMARANETCDLLFDRPKYTVIKELAEYDFGAFELCTHEQLQHDSAYLQWLDGDDDVKPPSGESRRQFKERILVGVKRVADMVGDDEAVVVTHSGVIVNLLSHYMGERDNFTGYSPDFGGGYTVFYDGYGKFVEFRKL